MKVADLFAQLRIAPDKRSFSSADRLLGGVKKAIVGIAAFKGVSYLKGMIDETAQSADMFSKLSKKLGISTEGLQQLEFAAGISGTSIDVLRVGLQRFARNASDAERGLSTAKDALKDAGVAFKDGAGGLRSVDDMLMDVADRFAAMPDGTKKTALSMELFGRSGAELIPLLNEGRAGISKLREEFVSLGAQIDGKTAQQFEQLNDDQLRVRTAMKGIRNQVVIALLPTLRNLTTQLLEWVKANKELIRQKLEQVIRVLIFGFRLAAKAVGLFVKAIGYLEEHPALLYGIAAAFVALKVASVAAAIATGASWLLASLPLLLIAALIIGVALLIKDLWDWFSKGEGVIHGLWEGAVDFFVGIIEWIDKAIGKVKKFFSDLAEGAHLFGDFLMDWNGSEFEKVGAKTAGGISAGRAKFRAPTVTRQTNQSSQSDVFSPQITVNAQTGASAESIAGEVSKAAETLWDRKMREAAAGVK